MSEQATYIELLDDMREGVRAVLLGLHGEGLNWQPLPTDTSSIYNTAQHCAWVEDYWIGFIAAEQGFPYQFPYRWDNNEDFNSSGEDPSDLLVLLDHAATRTAAFFAALQPGDLDASRTRTRGDGLQETRTVRWGIIHTIEHYSEHIGQMRLTRQLWEATQ